MLVVLAVVTVNNILWLIHCKLLCQSEHHDFIYVSLETQVKNAQNWSLAQSIVSVFSWAGIAYV